MLRLKAPIMIPLFLLNLIGIVIIFILELDNRDYEPRTLQENYQEYSSYKNLRGSLLKIKINGKPNISLNNSFFKEEYIEKIKESHLRKLKQNNYGMYINIVPSLFCLVILCSFCVDESSYCFPNFSENSNSDYYENDYNSHHIHHHHHHHRHHHEDKEKKDDEDDKKALGLLICILILVIIAIVYIIPRACGKYIARIASLVILCISYGLMIAFYAIKLNDGNYENVEYLFSISIALFIFNLAGLILPLIIGCCHNKINKGTMDKSFKLVNDYN